MNKDGIIAFMRSFLALNVFPLAFLTAVVFFFFCPTITNAQSQGAGIGIIPAQIEEQVEPGGVHMETLTITNLAQEARTLFFYTREIIGVEGAGIPIFADDTAEVTGFEMTEWIHLSVQSLDFEPGEEKQFTVTIAVPNDATPGSHFAGVFVSAEAPRLRTIGAGVGYEVVTVISTRVDGDVVDDARIRSFSTDKLFYSSKDVDFIAQIENQGNILIRPRGPLTITNMLGGEVTNFTVNDTQAGVFPGVTRTFEVDWVDDTVGFGRYTAEVALAYNGDVGVKTIDSSVTFWILPTKIVLTVLGVLITLIAVGYVLIRLYVHRAVTQSSGRRVVPQRYRRQVGISRFAFVFISVLAVVTLFLIVMLVVLA